MAVNLKAGKLPSEFLNRLLKKYAQTKDKRIIIGPQIGVDASVIKYGKNYIVLKTDPITFTTDDIGWYSIVINSNDIACMGAIPKWYLGTLLLPANKTTKKQVERMFKDIKYACNKFNITLCGGHVEITHGIDRPILIGFIIGEITDNKFISSKNARIGDNIIVTKSIAIECVSIIAREKQKELSRMFGVKKVKKWKNFIYNPGISILKEALLSKKYVNAMHDPTEGGIATGLDELAIASNKGMLINYEKIPVINDCKLLCQKYKIDPLGVIASGSLLATVPPDNTKNLINIYKKHGISYAIIGKIMPEKYGIKMIKNGKICNLKKFSRDEITKIF